MAIYFTTKVRRSVLQDNGALKSVTESYLVDAQTFTEAEARIHKELDTYMIGEYSVVAATQTNIAEIFYGNDWKWWLVKWSLITIDEKSGKTAKEKKVTMATLVQGLNLQDALDCFNKGMSGTVADYDIISIAETPILDVYTRTDD